MIHLSANVSSCRHAHAVHAPSCLTSKAQRPPSGTVRDGVGRHGSMKPIGRAGEGERESIKVGIMPCGQKRNDATKIEAAYVSRVTTYRITPPAMNSAIRVAIISD